MSSKKFKVLTDFAPAKKSRTSAMNWDICCLCQEMTNEALKDPKKDKNPDGPNTTYDSLAYSIEQFNEYDLLPEPIDYVSLKDGKTTVQESLKENAGEWHKTCRLKLSKKNLDRGLKCKTASGNTEIDSPVKTRQTRGSQSLTNTEERKCIFCEKGEETSKHHGQHKQKLRRASTLAIDNNVRQFL